MKRIGAAILLLTGWLMMGTGPLAAEEQRVDLELVLAVDISLSMDYDEQRVQREGYAGAFRHPEVISAIRTGGGFGRIAVTYVEWAGVGTPRIVVPWTVVDGAETAEAFAARLDAAPLEHALRTSISTAIQFSAALFDDSGYRGLRRVIDVSGDGPNNQGIMVTDARDATIRQGIVINGLPVMLKQGNPAGFFDINDLDVYYEDCVIGGTGAFIVPVYEKAKFAAAIRRKLVLEIAGLEPRLVPAQAANKAPRIDCLIGERLWQQYMGRRWEYRGSE